MSLEDLEDAGILLPRDEWGKHEIKTRQNKPLVLLLAAAAVVSVVLMYFGDGRRWTWIGLGLFLLALGAFTSTSLHTVNQQNES